MIKRFFAVLLVVSVLMGVAACDKQNKKATEPLSVYYVNSGKYEEGGEYIEAVEYEISSGDDLVNNALEYLSNPPAESGFTSALIKGTRIYSYALEGDSIDVALSPAYLLLNDFEKSVVKCCITLTLCGIGEIESVNIYVDEKLVEERLDVSMMIIADTDTNELEKRISLYFPETNLNFLQTEYRVLTVGRDTLLAEYVVEELINSTQTEGLVGSMPMGTKLISAEMKNRVCTINLSEEFVTNRPESASGQRMTVYSIVNSLTNLDNIEKVRFLVEGKQSNAYEYIDISDSFVAFEDIIYDPQEASKLFATIYLGMDDSEKMIKTPVIIDRDSEKTIEENIVRYVLGLSKVSGYKELIPNAIRINSIENVNGVCSMDLSNALFANGSGSIATLAACAIAASIIDSGAATTVTITVEGKRFLENIPKYSNLIIE